MLMLQAGSLCTLDADGTYVPYRTLRREHERRAAGARTRDEHERRGRATSRCSEHDTWQTQHVDAAGGGGGIDGNERSALNWGECSRGRTMTTTTPAPP